MFVGIIDMAAESRAEVGIVAGGVGDQVVAPIVEHAPMGIGKSVGDVSFESARARLVSINGGVLIAVGRTPGRFHLGAMKDAVAQVNRAAGVQDHGIGRVMGIGRVQSVQDRFLPIGVVVVVGI